MATVTYSYEELLAHKNSGIIPAAAIDKLRNKADELLGKPTVKVTEIQLPRPSGNPHDYVSMGPYWWPNPDTPDGLPWVNRDGEYNPLATSAPRVAAVYLRILTLALAEFYIGGGKYAECAVRQLYDWFLNPETKMNPHATYAQGIPGHCDGRSLGLIDFASAYKLFNAIGILEGLGLISDDMVLDIKKWFVAFGDWILTHEYGIGAGNAGNNHGSWHDANVIATAVFTGREALVKSICNTAYFNRIVRQITPIGEQPRELARTQSLEYSFVNLCAMLVVANVAEKYGYTEYWGIDEVRGECILASAVNFLYGYIKNPEAYPYKNIHGIRQKSENMARLLLSVAKRYPDGGYAERAKEFITDDADFWLEPIM